MFGEGPHHAPLLLIGEAPGAEEERLGRPFVGKAGKNLDELLTAVALRREAIRITNAVKVRPTKRSAAGNTVNRPPDRRELAFFAPVLAEELRLEAPGLIVTLGNTPLNMLAGKEITVGAAHGAVLETGGLRLFPLYHPAAIIYNRSLKTVYDGDMRTLAALVRQMGLYPAEVEHG